MNAVEQESFPRNKHYSDWKPNNCVRQTLINSRLPNKSECQGTFHFPIKIEQSEWRFAKHCQEEKWPSGAAVG